MNTTIPDLRQTKERGFKTDPKLKILNGHEKAKEGSSRGDTTTNLHNFSSRFFLVSSENLENANLEAPRPENTTNTVSGSRPDFSEKSENHENRLELDPYLISRAENQAIWNLKVL